MNKCFEFKNEGCKRECNGVRVLAAIDFYNNNPEIGDIVRHRSDKRHKTEILDFIDGRIKLNTTLGVVRFCPCSLVFVERRK